MMLWCMMMLLSRSVCDVYGDVVCDCADVVVCDECAVVVDDDWCHRVCW